MLWAYMSYAIVPHLTCGGVVSCARKKQCWCIRRNWPVITDRAVPLGVDEIALTSRRRREQRTEIKMASLAKERVPMVD